MLVRYDEVALCGLVIHEFDNDRTAFAFPHVDDLFDRFDSDSTLAKLIHKESVGGMDQHQFSFHADSGLLRWRKRNRKD